MCIKLLHTKGYLIKANIIVPTYNINMNNINYFKQKFFFNLIDLFFIYLFNVAEFRPSGLLFHSTREKNNRIMCVCKVFCPEAGPSLDVHYQGGTYLSLLDKRKE